jgi:hypothetical protein
MANKTINDFTDLGTTPAAGDFFAIWDLDAAAQKKVDYTNLLGFTVTGGGTIATGGFTFTIPATGTPLLATGISGGQTGYGGTAAGDDLTLDSTSNATKGDIVLQPSGGNVGIGTATPQTYVHVIGDAAVAGMGYPVTAHQLIVENGGDNSTILVAADDADWAQLLLATPSDDNAGRVRWDYTNSQMTVGTANVGAHLRFTTGDYTERVRIDSSGNMGIGTISPGSLLDVNGSVRGAYDADTTSYFGRAAVGYMGTSDVASFAHLDSNTSTSYSLMATTVGETYLNAASGQAVYHRINNSTIMTMTANGLGIGGIPIAGTLLKIHGDNITINTAKTPSSASDTGATGQFAWDATYFYICVATNTWERVSHATW